MPKFTYEIDTGAKTTKVMVDGEEVVVSDFSVGCYSGKDYNTQADYRECYASLTRNINDTSRLTYSYSFRDGPSPSYSEAITSYQNEVAKVAAKAVARTIAQYTLEKAMAKHIKERNGGTD